MMLHKSVKRKNYASNLSAYPCIHDLSFLKRYKIEDFIFICYSDRLDFI